MTGIPVLTVAGTQTTLTGDVVDTSTAEAMIAEALRMVDETTERERLAVMRARSWEERMELATSLLKAEENRTDRVREERMEAESRAAAAHATQQMAEQLLAAEAALADAALADAVHEHNVRRQAEAQRDMYQALAGARRGGRGGRGPRWSWACATAEASTTAANTSTTANTATTTAATTSSSTTITAASVDQIGACCSHSK